MVALLVGDGEPTRTHRRILLDPNAGACGVAVTKHKTFENRVCEDVCTSSRRRIKIFARGAEQRQRRYKQ